MINWAKVSNIENLSREEMDGLANDAISNKSKIESLAMFDFCYRSRLDFIESEYVTKLVKMLYMTKRPSHDVLRLVLNKKEKQYGVKFPEPKYELNFLKWQASKTLEKLKKLKGQS